MVMEPMQSHRLRDLGDQALGGTHHSAVVLLVVGEPFKDVQALRHHLAVASYYCCTISFTMLHWLYPLHQQGNYAVSLRGTAPDGDGRQGVPVSSQRTSSCPSHTGFIGPTSAPASAVYGRRCRPVSCFISIRRSGITMSTQLSTLQSCAITTSASSLSLRNSVITSTASRPHRLSSCAVPQRHLPTPSRVQDYCPRSVILQ